METTNKSKTDKMKKNQKDVILYTNIEAVNYEMAAIDNTLNEVKAVKQYLVDSDVLLTALTIEQACNKSFDAIVANFIETEKSKLKDFEAKFGVLSLISGNSEERLQVEAEKLRSKLIACLPAIHYQSGYYFECIDFETIQIKPEFNEKFFERKNSIIADDEMAQHHQNAVDAYRYFLDKFPDYNTAVVMGLLLKVNFLERTCELNLDAYDPQKQIRDFVYKRINEPDYSIR